MRVGVEKYFHTTLFRKFRNVKPVMTKNKVTARMQLHYTSKSKKRGVQKSIVPLDSSA